MLKNSTSDKSATDVAGKSLTEEFMAACYEFRRNVLSDKYEMREVTEPSAEAEEIVYPLMTSEVVGILARSFPEMKVTAGMNVKVGRQLSALNFERKVVTKGTVYYIVPMKKSA